VKVVNGRARPQSDVQKQFSQVENFVAQKVDAIILNPCELEASTPAVDYVKKAGIPLVLVNQTTKSVGDSYIGSNDFEAGRMAMEAIARKLNGQGGVLMLHGIMGTSAQLQREAGAREVFAKYPGLKLVDHQTASWDRAKAMALTENWIQAHKGKFSRSSPTTTRWPWAPCSPSNAPVSRRTCMSSASTPSPRRSRP
jgi:ABC-type sugar transport system substrate-binding protein